MVELSSQDSLRLNVLLATKPQAIRIDESRMIVYALSEKGEAQVALNPTCNDEKYVKAIKELLSGHVLGSPGGYPIYLRRWTRMGQMRDESLEQLLLLGEPEAIVAAVCANGLTDELARRAWWAMEEAENARRMLNKTTIVEGEMGPVLAKYLVDHLAFETEAEKLIESIRLVLQPGLIGDQEVETLWKKASRKTFYFLGFLSSRPNALPVQAKAHGLYGQVLAKMDAVESEIRPMAEHLALLLSPPGQAWLATMEIVWQKPTSQEVVNSALDELQRYFAAFRPEGQPDQTFEQLTDEANSWLKDANSPGASLLKVFPELTEQILAARILSGMSYGVVRPIFKDTTAIGSLMRKKLDPVISPLRALLMTLVS